MNYSFGFIAIYVLGFTLATKQPAMTAAALISALEDGLKSKETILKNIKVSLFYLLDCFVPNLLLLLEMS